jgi:hypothetical protein
MGTVILRTVCITGGVALFAFGYVYAKEAIDVWLGNRRFLRENPHVVVSPKHRMPQKYDRIHHRIADQLDEVDLVFRMAVRRINRRVRAR